VHRVLHFNRPCPAPSHLTLSYADFNCVQGLCACFALSVIRQTVADTLQGGPRLDPTTSCLLSILHQARRASPRVPLPSPTLKAEQSSISTVSSILLRALIYNTDTNNIPQPDNSQSASVSFHRSSHETFLPRQPLYWHLSNSSPTVGVLVGLVATSPNVFRYEFDACKSGASHSRSPLFSSRRAVLWFCRPCRHLL